MDRKEIKVTFQPSGRSVFVLPGTLLVEAAGRAGISLQTPCGGKGTCGKCKLRVVSGKCSYEPTDDSPLTPKMVEQGYRPACQARVEGPLVIEVPQESMFESRPRILVEDAGEKTPLKPAVKDVSAETFGAAFDIGTTTIVGTLFSLCDGEEHGVSSRMNPQVSYGDDVISRIKKVREEEGGLEELRKLVAGAVNEIVAELARNAGIGTESIRDITAAGNSTMQQIFCGIDCSGLGEIPFQQAFDDAQILPASKLGVEVNPEAKAFVFPQIGGFVGGDTVAGMVASRLDQWKKPVLFIDIGTNGEIVLAHNGSLLATSAAAGPAFEGARIRHGMRAAEGAIEKIVIEDDVLLNVIGNARPAGICGTALIDAAASLLSIGIIDTNGRVLSPDEAPSDLPENLRWRLVSADDGPSFVLAAARETASGEAICLYQRDVRELQLASGAIRAGTNILLRMAGLKPDDLGAVLLAGAFGNFIRRDNACRIGLLPQIPHDRIRFIGNAASLGAKLALLSTDERDYAAGLRNRAEHVDLSADLQFQMEFAEGMIFPKT